MIFIVYALYLSLQSSRCAHPAFIRMMPLPPANGKTLTGHVDLAIS
ncbi:hypothetical protein ACLB1N_00475 [Escherichia coli]